MRGFSVRQQPPSTSRIIALLLSVVAVAYSVNSSALDVELPLPGGSVATADYMQRSSGDQALVVLHGFLQSNRFLATQNIAEGLAGLGYTVLAPNLTLGTSRRRQSMDCAAAHVHTLAQDRAEIKHWIDWLQSKGFDRIVLVGQSWGSRHAVDYQSHTRDSRVQAIIGISLVRDRASGGKRNATLADARRHLRSDPTALHDYPLNFCQRYASTAASYLSYAEFDDQRTLQSISRLEVPVHVILGSADKRYDAGWVQALRKAGAKITIIAGANHFFSAMHEFDLNDRLADVLKIVAPRSSNGT
jgi:dienelactone hydrolase